MKIAFMFLTPDNHNQGSLWEGFFDGQYREQYNIYCHATYPDSVTQKFLKENILQNKIHLKSADISIVKATILLLRQAFQNQENEYFVLLSENCVPLYDFPHIYKTLNKNKKSHLNYFNIETSERKSEYLNRWRQLKDNIFDKFYSQDKYFILNREAVELILQCDYTHIFENMHAPEEHYFINLLIRNNFPVQEKIVNQMVTFANWKDCEVERIIVEEPEETRYEFKNIHPKTYQDLSIGDILDARSQGCLFMRKLSSECDSTYIQPANISVIESLELAIQHHQANRLEAAEILYRQILETYPEEYHATYGLGTIAQQKGEIQEAENLLTKAVLLKPDSVETRVNLGKILQAQGKLSQQHLAYYADLNYKLGITKAQIRDFETACACYRQAIALKPDMLDAYTQLWISLQKQQKWPLAIACVEKSLEIDPNYGQAYLALGQIYQEQNCLEEAIAAYRQGLKLINPHYATVANDQNKAEISESVPVPPTISWQTARVGDYLFPAIPPVVEQIKQRPFWSVVIPAHNRPDYLLECLVSVLAQWNGEVEMEIIVIDDASTPPLYDLVQKIGSGIVRYFRNQENLKQQGTWNTGVALTRGLWVHLLHDDDYVLPGFYERLKQSLKDCSDSVKAAFTGYENINENRQVIFQKQLYQTRGIAADFLQKIGVANPLNPPAVVIHRSVYETLGAYHPDLTATLDWEMYKRIASFYDWWCEPDILVHYRQHSRSMRKKLSLKGTRTQSIRRSIEISESYLPIDYKSAITKKARHHYFKSSLGDSLIPVQTGNFAAAFNMLQETLKIDSSPQSTATLFSWLTTDKAASLREEIISNLFPANVSDNSKDKSTIAEIQSVAVQCYQNGYFAQAESFYFEIMRMHPFHHDALLGLSLLMDRKYKDRERQTADQFLNAATHLYPDSFKAWFNFGNLCQARGKLEKAVNAFQKALSIQPGATVYNNLGYTLQLQGLCQEAITYYRKALELEPNYIEADVNLANALHTQKQLSSEKLNYYARVNNDLGMSREKAGDLKTAIAYYRHAIALQSNLEIAQDNLETAIQKKESQDKAIADYLEKERIGYQEILKTQTEVEAAFCQKIWSEVDRKYMQEVILPSIGAANLSKVLFIGCGPYTKHYNQYFNPERTEYWTTDIDEGCSQWGEKGRHIVANAQKINEYFPEHEFDAVIFSGVLGYGINDDRSINETLEAMHSILKPGGIFVLGWQLYRNTDPRELKNMQRLFDDDTGLGLPKRVSFEDAPYHEGHWHTYDFLRAK